jgi:hypothetical protein
MMSARRARTLLTFLAAGCGGGGTALSVDGAAPAGDAAPDAVSDAPAGPFKLDILFLIDNSASTSDDKQNLHRALPAFFDELKKARGGLPDLHIGAITTDVGAGTKPLARSNRPVSSRPAPAS